MKNSKKVTKKSPAVKIVKIEDNFFEEEDDNRVIIFVAIAILVIIGTIIGILVGCEKKEDKDPVKPKDDIVVPSEENKDTEEEEKTETKTTIRKVTTKSNDNKEKTYVISFNLLDEDDVYTVEAKDGKVTPYIPSGYTSCKYYTDENLTNEFDFNKTITENTNIYTSCSIKSYKIIYDRETSSQKEYDLKEGKVALSKADLETGFFEGWYLTPNYDGERVDYLSKNIAKVANENDEVYLYAKVADNYKIRFYYDNSSEPGATFTYTSEKDMPAIIENYGGSAPEGMRKLGFATKPGSNVIEYQVGEMVTLTGDLDLYPVFGNANVIYESEGETITVGMTSEELNDYNLPTPDEVGIKTPTYYVKVDKTNENTKEVVPDEIEELLENQVRLSDAKNKAGENETIEVGDNIEELEKEFVGWQTKEVDGYGNETLTDVDDTYKPEDNKDNELVAKWKEQDKTTDTTDMAELSETSEELDTQDIIEETEDTDIEVSTNIEVVEDITEESTL